MKTINLPENARFSCQSCGHCCQGWAVPVDEATVQRLRAHNWGGEPFQRGSPGGDPYQIRLINGRCFFLDDQNRCRIHITLSYEEKPHACRAFPLAVLDVDGKRYARLSYWCPTVVANSGKPLEHQARWVSDTAKQSDHRDAPFTLSDQAEISSIQFGSIHRALRHVMLEPSLPIADRLAAGAALLQRLESAGGADVDGVIRQATSAGWEPLARESRAKGDRSSGKRMLSLYFLQDRAPGRASLLARLLSLLMFNTGLGRIGSRAIGARASRREMSQVSFTLSATSRELLQRYLTSKIDSRRYVVGDASVVTGFNLLVAAYGMIHALSRMRAACERRTATNDEDVTFAVRAADLLVIEHATLYQDKFRKQLVRLALGNSNLAGGVMAFLDNP